MSDCAALGYIGKSNVSKVKCQYGKNKKPGQTDIEKEMRYHTYVGDTISWCFADGSVQERVK